MKEKIIHILPPLVGLVLFGAALWVLHHELTLYHFADIRRHLAAMSLQSVAAASLLTVISYLIDVRLRHSGPAGH